MTFSGITALVRRSLGGRQVLAGPFGRDQGHLWIASSAPSGGDDETNPFRSRLCLYENDTRLTAAHHGHPSIRLGGSGRYSHWGRRVFFSTTDGSDPNTNGRTYSFDFSLDLETWERERIERSAKRWYQHPHSAQFIARGGDLIPPPLIANLGLTNKCNLRCEICGSQKHLDVTGIRRRHMEFATFEAVAETLFPVLSQVELNSQGDPLLHPGIDDVLATIERHRCEVKIQHNGTLLTDRIIDLLLQQHGMLMLSLDAVGDRFDEVRRGGVWIKAEAGLTRLLRERDPCRLSVGVYPTWTTRTIGEAINIANWCSEHAVDVIGFHRYTPVQGSWEEAPTEEMYRRARDQLRQWCFDHGDPLRILFEGEGLNRKDPSDRRTQYADVQKALALQDTGHVMFPIALGRFGADPFMTCAAPNEYVEISLDGKVSVCCRSQDVSLGYATSVDDFAKVWLGQNYGNIRRSLVRGQTGAYPLPNCLGCVKFYAPQEDRERRAIDYVRPTVDDVDRLRLDEEDEYLVEGIQKEQGFCHIAMFPLGIRPDSFELWEDDTPLGPAGCLHDEIRKKGAGRYHIGATSVYFSASDGTDARRNGRTYSLRRVSRADVRAAGYSTT
ncbi:MAG: radical SAM protein [Hyphomicrobiales bacterium]|nr:radical SAM protein [Hyphomicrobiales bacterium]